MNHLAAAAAALLVIFAAGCSAANGSPKSPQTVEIRIRHSRFEPAVLRFKAGDAVKFVIRNEDPIDHEFILGNSEVQSRHERGTESVHTSIPGEVSIPAGTKAATNYKFAKPEDLLFACHLPGHFEYGMKGQVKVT